MINALSSTPFWPRDSDGSDGEYMSDESYKRLGYQQEQEVFSDYDESPDIRRTTKEEREAYTVETMEQVLSNYRLRNKNVNLGNEQAAWMYKISNKNAEIKKAKIDVPKRQVDQTLKIRKPVDKQSNGKEISNCTSFMS